MGKKHKKGKKSQAVEKVVGWNQGDWVLTGGAQPGAGGKMVTPTTAMSEPTIYACISYLADDIAKVPINMWRTTTKTRTLAKNSALYKTLNHLPNPFQSAYEWKQYTQTACLTYGNAYNLIVRNARNEVVELLPIHPNRVEIFEGTEGDLWYLIAANSTFESGQMNRALPEYQNRVAIPEYMIWHMRWGAKGSGVYGSSPIEHQRDAVSTALAQQEFSGKMMANDARPSMVLKHPGRLKPDAAKRLKSAWDNAYKGTSNAARTAVLEEGIDVESMSMNAVDAQFIEQRKFSVIEIARIFRVPPTKLMVMDRATYSNVEQENLSYITDSLMPIFERWESSMSRWLLNERDQGKIVFEFEVERLLRGDSKARFDSYAAARQWGIYTSNEARHKEGLNPVSGGDMLLQPLNMTAAGNDPLDLQREKMELDAKAQEQAAEAQAQAATDQDQNQQELDNDELAKRIKLRELERGDDDA
jgi:HK97 family phage portal protein